MPAPTEEQIDTFIARWETSGGHERANYGMFLTELCALLDLPQPDPARPENQHNAYTFERAVTRAKPDGTTPTVFIDLYRAGHFVLETKQGSFADSTGSSGGLFPDAPASVSAGHGRRGTRLYDREMERAYNQAERYIHDLPAAEGRPPFLIVCDVGHVFELYAEFSRTGGRYQRFPDPKNHRIFLEDLRDPEKRAVLRAIWTDPLSLDPSRRVAKVTRDIAGRLATLARSLESEGGHDPESVALFLQRCLFTMFAEDIGLLPDNGFLELLEKVKATPQGFPVLVTGLWKEMATGTEFSAVLMKKIAHFNGGLFDHPTALPLTGEQIVFLIHAARADWTEVDPAIFGTLLERALDPRERHKLGAHYTPRSYVERLILPAVIEPLRDEWESVKGAAVQWLEAGQEKKARAGVEDCHHRLCNIRVLDPACGSGNFLYVTLEHLKRLEAEVLDFFESIGGDRTLEMEGYKVRPEQFHGLEINPAAVNIAQLVLWIGYFQWHYRTTGRADTNDRPLLPKQNTILHRDAVLAYDEKIPRKDADGNFVTIWDGRTTRPHPVTGREVPDDSARILLFDYTNPRRPDWPEADYVVGNPPFVGASRMRDFLGDGYTEAVRKAWKGDVPESADFVMFWWQRCAQSLREGKIRRFGLITTNSIHQTFNRRVLEPHLNAEKNPMHLAFAIPDHPWVDSADGAAVRIAMTVGDASACSGTLNLVVSESEIEDGEHQVKLKGTVGIIAGNLRLGAPVGSALRLQSNDKLSCPGVKLHGSGFIVAPDVAKRLGLGTVPEVEAHIRGYRNGKDISNRPRGVMVIDLLGISESAVQSRFPEIYQHVLDTVKPERASNKRATYRDKWWIFGEPRKEFRPALDGLRRFVATPETSKHRFFVFLDESILPDNMLVNIAVEDAFFLGSLSSQIHVKWALIAGGRLGFGNDPRYNKTRCFETFPFPDPDDATRDRIRDLGEKLDAHRKRQQAAHPGLTLTGMYNVLEKLRAAERTGPSSGGGAKRPAEPSHPDSASAGPSGSLSSGNLSAETNPKKANDGSTGTSRPTLPAPRSAGILTPQERQIHDDGLVSVLKQIHDELDEAVFHAYGWDDLWKRLSTGRKDDAEAVEAELLERLVALNHERAAEERQGKVRWLRPEFQNPAGTAGEPATKMTQMESAIVTPADPAVLPPRALAWPADLPGRFAAIRQLLSAQPAADPETLSAAFGRKSPKRQDQIRQILETLKAMGQL